MQLNQNQSVPLAEIAPAPGPACAAARPADLPESWRQPDRCDWFTTPDGTRLRFGLWAAPPRCRGTVLIFTGRGEFVEKYGMEIAGEMSARGFAVASFDWRGQGLSGRALADRHKGHIDNFTTYLADLEEFLRLFAGLDLPRPWLALAHSMGGHLVLQHLAAAADASPLAGAFLCAPMTGLRREAAIRTALMLLPETPAIEQRFFIYGSGPFRMLGREFIGNRVTHDERRFRFTETWFRADPRLALGGPTVGWLRQALRSVRRLDAPGTPERIARPVTILSAGLDLLVDSSTHAGLAARIPGAACIAYPDSRHEIMMEQDSIRARFLSAFDAFVAGTLRP